MRTAASGRRLSIAQLNPGQSLVGNGQVLSLFSGRGGYRNGRRGNLRTCERPVKSHETHGAPASAGSRHDPSSVYATGPSEMGLAPARLASKLEKGGIRFKRERGICNMLY